MKPLGLQRYTVFVKYAAVGTLGTAIDLASLYVFVSALHIPLLLSVAGSFILAVINNFILNKYWTFQNRNSNVRKQFIKFLIVSVMGLLLTEVFMAVFVYLFRIWYMLAKLLTSVLVLTWNFLANRYWTFRDRIFHVSVQAPYKYDISVIIPAYNEQNRLAATLQSINDYFSRKKSAYQIIVVDDGSTDGTRAVAEERAKEFPALKVISYKPNRGKGYAVRQGVLMSEGECILFADADNSTPVQEFDKFRSRLNSNKVVIGSRYLPDSNIVIKQPFFRVAIGRLGNALIQFFLLDEIRDTQCGFKAFQHEAAQEIFSRMKVNRFGFDIELLSIARLLNYPIAEVPVSWYNSPGSRIRPVKDALRTFGELVYIKLNLWGGRYV